MDVDILPSHPQTRALGLDTWPFELFIYLTKYLDVFDIFTLRLVNRAICAFASDKTTWRILAEDLSALRPIPIEPPDNLPDLAYNPQIHHGTLKLMKSLHHAARVHYNWEVAPQPLLRKITAFHPRAHKREGDISYLICPGSRYLVTTEWYEREGISKLTISDIQMQVILESWPYSGDNKRVLQWRIMEKGAAIMFVFHQGITEAGLVEYELVRFEFGPDPTRPSGTFKHYANFQMARQLADLTLTEDLVISIGVEDDGALSFYILDWRNSRMGTLRTDLPAPKARYHANLAGPYLALWIPSPTQSQVYNFPLSLITEALSLPPGSELAVQAPAPKYLNFVDERINWAGDAGAGGDPGAAGEGGGQGNEAGGAAGGGGGGRGELVVSQRSRKWETCKGEEMRERQMSVVSYWRVPEPQPQPQPPNLPNAPHPPANGHANPPLLHPNGNGHAPPHANGVDEGQGGQGDGDGEVEVDDGDPPPPTVLVSMSHHHLPVPFLGTPVYRTWLPPRRMSLFSFPGRDPYPIFFGEAKAVVWIEYDPNLRSYEDADTGSYGGSHGAGSSGSSGGRGRGNGRGNGTGQGSRGRKKGGRRMCLCTVPRIPNAPDDPTPEELIASSSPVSPVSSQQGPGPGQGGGGGGQGREEWGKDGDGDGDVEMDIDELDFSTRLNGNGSSHSNLPSSPTSNGHSFPSPLSNNTFPSSLNPSSSHPGSQGLGRNPRRRTKTPWSQTASIKSFPLPSVFDLDDLHHMTVDEASGVMGLSFSDGCLWLLHYDGYLDDRLNLNVETLKEIFPNHRGVYSLGRDQ